MLSLKALASRYDTDKALNDTYLHDFEESFGPLRDRPLTLLELGIMRGGSLQMWRDYFPAATIVGLDINETAIPDETGRIRTYRGRQDDTQLLDQIRAVEAADGFDIVIDDCSHLGGPTRTSFWHLFPHHLKPGGIYCIEDWGTGYWPSWPDGQQIAVERGLQLRNRLHRLVSRVSAVASLRNSRRVERVAMRLERALVQRRFPSHDFGMVGFVKELIDECGVGDATMPGRGSGSFRPSTFSQLRVSQGHVFVFKTDMAQVVSGAAESGSAE